MFLMLCFFGFLIARFNEGAVEKTEVALSDVIMRANDSEGNIAKITVTGSTLDITLKGKDQPTETSRKDGSGTLYDMGLKTLEEFCEGVLEDELVKCQESYPVIEYKEEINTAGIILDVALTVLPIIALVVFFSWMMRQATAARRMSSTQHVIRSRPAINASGMLRFFNALTRKESVFPSYFFISSQRS